MFLRKFCQQDPKFKRKFEAILEMAFCERVSLRPPSSGVELRDIQHSMSMILEARFYTWFIMIRYYKIWQMLLKCDKNLLQNDSGFSLQNATVLLQNVTVITKGDVYYKLWQYMQYQSCHAVSRKTSKFTFVWKERKASKNSISHSASLWSKNSEAFNVFHNFKLTLILKV